jgi:hypothetical protein
LFQESVQFEASTGFFLRGKVSPPVEGVKINLVDMKSRASKQTVFTNEQGTYKVCPSEDFNFMFKKCLLGYF